MIDPTRVSKEIFKSIKSHGWQVKLYDEQGMSTVDPEVAVRFYVDEPNFLIFVDGEEETIEINRNGNEDLSVYLPVINTIKRVAREYMYRCDIRDYGKKITPKDFSYQAKTMKESTDNMDNQVTEKDAMRGAVRMDMDTLVGDDLGLETQLITASTLDKAQYAVELLRDMGIDAKVTAKQTYFGGPEYYVRFRGQSSDKEDVIDAMSSRSSVALTDSINESVMYGTKKTSKQVIENVKLVIKHRKPVDENVVGARSRNIGAIFLECGGERFKFPSNSLSGARAMARHMSNGGSMSDTIGESIIGMTDRLIKLKEFYRYVKTNKLINESSEDVVLALVESIRTLKTDLNALYGKKTYETAVIRLSEKENLINEGEDAMDYREMFTVKKFDNAFEAVLPIISGIVQENKMKMQRIEESSLNTVYISGDNMMFEDTGLVFETSEAKFGQKLKNLAVRVVENDELSGFLTNLGEKLIQEGKISAFEMKIVKNVFENIKVDDEKEEKTDTIQESVLQLEESLTKLERNAYETLLNEGVSDFLSGAVSKFKSFFADMKDELLDLGARLKTIQQAIQSGAEVHEAASGFGQEGLQNPTLMKFRVAVQRFEAARRGLGFANKLKKPEDRAKHKSAMMKNMNLLRREVESLESSLGIEKQVDTWGKRLRQAPNKFMKGTIWEK